MKSYILMIFIFWVLLFKGYAQSPDTLTLEKCYALCEENDPLRQGIAMHQDILLQKDKNLQTEFYPKTELNAQATYQSETIEFDLPIQGFRPPEFYKDQYKIALEINQLVYDGGITRRKKEVENLSTQLDIQEVEVNMYQKRQLVNQYYFSILLNHKQQDLIKTVIELLTSRIETVQAGVENGILFLSDLRILKVELLKYQQQQDEIIYKRKAFYKMMGILTGQDIREETYFAEPVVSSMDTSHMNRPELTHFSLLQEKIQSQREMVQRMNYPKLFGFGQVAYGRPGLNFFTNEFTPYYMLGAKLSWPLYDWGKNRREQKILTRQQDIISTKQDNFYQQLQLSVTYEMQEISRLEGIIEKDVEIMELRQAIRKEASVKLDQGVITSTDFIKELNAETEAKITRSLHEIQLLQAKVQAQYILGNEIK